MQLRRITLSLAICALALGGFATQAQAQGGHRGMKGRGGQHARSTATLQQRVHQRKDAAQRQDVFRDLGLTEEQVGKLQALRQEQRAQWQALREQGQRPTRDQIEQMRSEHLAQLKEILTPEQFARLEQARQTARQRGLRAQRHGSRRGGEALRHPLAEQLGLTPEQQNQLADLRKAQRARWQALREQGQRPTRDQIEQMRSDARAQFESILTPEQLEKLQQLRAERQERMQARRAPDAEAGNSTGTAKQATGSGPRETTWGAVKQQEK